jgi:ribosomal protein S18 acetylase RimI-like enzyme
LTPGAVEVGLVAPEDLGEPLSLLEEFVRDGETIPPSFVKQLARAVERGDLEVLVASTNPGLRSVGVIMLAFRHSASLGASFASIEDLYVRPGARRLGVGRALLEAVEERCKKRDISYVEVQTDDEAARFYEALGYEPEEGVRVLSRSYAF